MNPNNDFKNQAYTPYTTYSNINAMTNNSYSAPLQPVDNFQNQGVPQVVTNQIDEVEMNAVKMSLKSSGQFVACPYCRHQSVTSTEQNCSAKNVLCCVFFQPVSWVLFQAVRNKDINCYDVDHFCTRCGNKLAEYRAC